MDTPGIFAPKRRLDRAMVTSAWGVAQDADLVSLLIDAQRGLDEEARAILERLAPLRQPKLLVLNKIDLVPKPGLLALSAQLNEAAAFETTFMISALTGDGVADLKRWLADRVPEGPWHYPEDQLTDAPLRQFAADHQGDRIGSAPRDRRGGRGSGAPVSVREGARALGRGSRALPRDGIGVPEKLTAFKTG